MEMATDKLGVTESGKPIPVGTKCVYVAHLPGGVVKVEMPDGPQELVNPRIFKVLR